jgi:hypothetical protein
MPLEKQWQDYLDSWVIEAEAPCEPEEVDLFIIAVAAELTANRTIVQAAREWVRIWHLVDGDAIGDAEAALVAAVGANET